MSQTRLEKLLYLACRAEPSLGLTFEMDYGGPVSSEVRRRLIALTAGELDESLDSYVGRSSYSLTALGRITARRADGVLPEKVKTAIDETVRSF